jgi:hypothetical protein
MWFNSVIFELCSLLRAGGVEPKFQPGDLVARRFADLGHEEFQVLPGERLLSLTAGTSAPLPPEHRHHFFWIPSVDEVVELLERHGVEALQLLRGEGRTWRVQGIFNATELTVTARQLHEALLRALVEVRR